MQQLNGYKQQKPFLGMCSTTTFSMLHVSTASAIHIIALTASVFVHATITPPGDHAVDLPLSWLHRRLVG